MTKGHYFMTKLMLIFSAVALLCLAGCKKGSSILPEEILGELVIGEPTVTDIENTVASVSATINLPKGFRVESVSLSYRIASSPDWISVPAEMSPDSTRLSGSLAGLKAKTNYYCRFSVKGKLGEIVLNGVSQMKSFNTAGVRVELAKAATETVKVIVVIEDPLIEGQRFHTLGRWNDPYLAYPKLKEALENCSDGVVKYEIVEVIESDRLFTYFSEDVGKPDMHFTNERLKAYFLDDPQWTVLREHEKGWNILYDYLSMVKHYGLDAKRDKDEVHEVWVFSYPLSGMYESNYVSQTGKGFWLNSPPTGGASNEKLLTVMGYSYERGLAEAIHNNGHRLESIMKNVYGRWVTMNPGSEYTPGMAINNWEKYSLYDAIAPGKGQLGNTHYPVNAIRDYDYWSLKTVSTFRKSWKYYPDLQDLEEDKEEVNADTWAAMGNGDHQLGCMLNFFKHLPNKTGVNPADGKLNNWWLYMVNYEKAIELQNQ